MIRASSVVFSFLVLLLLACSETRTTDEHLHSAKGYFESGEYNAAIIELKNLLEKDGENVEARWLIGRIYHDRGLHADAVKELQKARQSGWSNDDVEPLLAKSLLEIGDYKTLDDLSIQSLSARSIAVVYAAKAWGQLRSGELSAAENLVGQANLAAPNLVYVKFVDTRIAAAKDDADLEGVKSSLREIISEDQGFTPALSFMGDIELQAEELERAETAFTQAIESNTGNLNDVFKRALVRLQLGEEAALEDIERLKRDVPDNPGTKYLQGIAEFNAGNYKQAIEQLELVKNYAERYPQSLLYLASAYDVEKNLVLAEESAYRFLIMHPENQTGIMILATLKLKAGLADEAISLLEPLYKQDKEDVSILNSLATAYFLKGELATGVSLLEQVIKLQPQSAEARLKLATALIRQESYAKAQDSINQALVINPNVKKANNLQIAAFLGQDKIDQALDVAKEFVERYPEDPAAKNILANVYLVKGERDLAQELYRSVLKIAPSNQIANERFASFAIEKGKFKEARAFYKQIIAADDNNLDIVLRIAAIDEILGDFDSMRLILERAIDQHPGEIQPRILLARYYLSNGRPEQVQILFHDFGDLKKRNPHSLNVLGMSSLHLGKTDEAVDYFERLGEIRPDAPQPQYHLGVSYLGQKEFSLAEQAFIKALSISSDYLEPRFKLVEMYLSQTRPNIDRAASHVQYLNQRAPEMSETMYFSAKVKNAEGDRRAALALFEKAYEAQPNTGSLLGLAKQLWLMGDEIRSLKLQEDWLQAHPDDLQVRVELGSVYYLKDDAEKAQVHFATALKQNEKNYVVLNNMAWLLRESDPKKALEYAEKSVELSSGSSAALDTLAMVLRAQGELERAARAIERAVTANGRDLSIKFHQAQILAEKGDVETATDILNGLLGADTQFPEKPQAKQLHQELR